MDRHSCGIKGCQWEILSDSLVEVILCPVEYSHLGGDKAEGRRQKAEGKEEGCKEEGYYGYLGGHDIIPSGLLNKFSSPASRRAMARLYIATPATPATPASLNPIPIHLQRLI